MAEWHVGGDGGTIFDAYVSSGLLEEEQIKYEYEQNISEKMNHQKLHEPLFSSLFKVVGLVPLIQRGETKILI